MQGPCQLTQKLDAPPQLRIRLIARADLQTIQMRPVFRCFFSSCSPSEWYPGQNENETFGDHAQWAHEYRHILAYEREHGPLVSAMSSAIPSFRATTS